MAKQVEKLVKLQIKGGAANPSPPVGPALGAAGVNIMEFCKAFNAQTQDKGGQLLPVVITVFSDKSFTFVIKTPPAAELIKKAASLSKGSGVPNRDKVGKMNWDQVKEIAETKMPDLNAKDLHGAMRMVAGTARSMGVTIDGPAPWEAEAQAA